MEGKYQQKYQRVKHKRLQQQLVASENEDDEEPGENRVDAMQTHEEQKHDRSDKKG